MPKAPDGFREWLEALPVDEVERELRELEAEAGRLETEIRARRRLLDLRNGFLGVSEDAGGQVRIRVGDTLLDNVAGNAARVRREVARTLEKQLGEIDIRGGQPSEGATIRGGRLVETSTPPRWADSADEPGDLTEAPPPASTLSRADKLLVFLDRYRGETWRLSDIRDRMVEEGLIGNSEAETHGLQVSASRLARTGKLERPEPGRYRLPPIDRTPTEGEQEEIARSES
jgi:hypothetical protein